QTLQTSMGGCPLLRAIGSHTPPNSPFGNGRRRTWRVPAEWSRGFHRSPSNSHRENSPTSRKAVCRAFCHPDSGSSFQCQNSSPVRGSSPDQNWCVLPNVWLPVVCLFL